MEKLLTFFTSLVSAEPSLYYYDNGYYLWNGVNFAQAFISLWQSICNGFYWICKWLLAVIDFLQYFVQKLIGLDYWLNSSTYTLEGATNGDLLFDFLYNDTVQRVFRTMLAVFFVLLIIFTIFAIIKQEWTFITGNDFGNGKGNSKEQILRGTIKAIALVLVFPIILSAGIISANAILASLIKALNIDMGTSFGNTIFYVSSINANKHRNYASNGQRSPTSDEVSFYIYTQDKPNTKPEDSNIGKRLVLSNMTGGSGKNNVVTVTSYEDYLKELPYTTKYTVDSMIEYSSPMTFNSSNNGFNGYCARLKFNDKERLIFVRVTNPNNVGRTNKNTKEAWYYYLKTVLGADIMTSGDSLGASNDVVKDIGPLQMVCGSEEAYISNRRFDDCCQDTGNIFYNSWSYCAIYGRNGQSGIVDFDSAEQFVSMNNGSGTFGYEMSEGIPNKLTTGEESLLNALGLQQHANVRMMFNSNYAGNYFDGGQFGVVQMQAEYNVMADVVDFMNKQDLPLYIMDATSDLLDYNYDGYAISTKWKGNDTEFGAQFKATNESTYIARPFVVSYSEINNSSETGKYLYLAKKNKTSELEGAVYVMAAKINESTYVPIYNGKAFFSPVTGKSYTFRSSYYSSDYEGVVIAKGTFNTKGYNTGRGDPTYIQTSTVGYGNSDSLEAPYYFDIVNNGKLIQYFDYADGNGYTTDTYNIESIAVSDNNFSVAKKSYDPRYDETETTYFGHLISSTDPSAVVSDALVQNMTITLKNNENGEEVRATYSGITYYAGTNKIRYLVFSAENGDGSFLVEYDTENAIVAVRDQGQKQTGFYREFTSNLIEYKDDVEYYDDYRYYNIHLAVFRYDIYGKMYVPNSDGTGNWVNVTNNGGDSLGTVNWNDLTGVGFSKYQLDGQAVHIYQSENIDYSYNSGADNIVNKSTKFSGYFSSRSTININSEGQPYLDVADPVDPDEDFSKTNQIDRYDIATVFGSYDYSVYLYDYATAYLDGYQGKNGIYDVNMNAVLNGSANDIFSSPAKVPTDSSLVYNFKVDDSTVWADGEDKLSLWDGKDYVGRLSRDTKTGAVDINDLTNNPNLTTIELDYIQYYYIRTQNKFAESTEPEAVLKHYKAISDSFMVTCIRDNLRYNKSFFDFNWAWFNNHFRFRWTWWGEEMQRDSVAHSFALSSGINFDYFFDSGIPVEEFYLSSRINYVIIIFASVLIIQILMKAITGVIKRFYEITLYFIAMPAVASTIPLDGGSRFTRTIQQPLIAKVLGTYGIMLGLNVFFVLLVPVESMSHIFTAQDIAESGSYFLKHLPFSVEVLNLYVYIMFLLVAFTMINALPKTISQMLDTDKTGGGDVVTTGDQTNKQMAQDLKATGDMVSGRSLLNAGEKGINMVKSLPGAALVGAGFRAGKWVNNKIRNRAQGKNDEAQGGGSGNAGGGNTKKSRAGGGEDLDEGSSAEETTATGGGEAGEAGEAGGVSTSAAANNMAQQVSQQVAQQSAEAQAENEYNQNFMNTTAGSKENDAMRAQAVKSMAENGDMAAKQILESATAADGTVDNNKIKDALNNNAKFSEFVNKNIGDNIAMGLGDNSSFDAATRGVILEAANQNEDVRANALMEMVKSGKLGAASTKYGLNGADDATILKTIKQLLSSAGDNEFKSMGTGNAEYNDALAAAAGKAAASGAFKFSAFDLKKAVDAAGADDWIRENGAKVDKEGYTEQERAKLEEYSMNMLKEDPENLFKGLKNSDNPYKNEIINDMVARATGIDKLSDADIHDKFNKLGYSADELLEFTQNGYTERDILLAERKAELLGFGKDAKSAASMLMDSDKTDKDTQNALIDAAMRKDRTAATAAIKDNLNDEEQEEILKTMLYDENGVSYFAQGYGWDKELVHDYFSDMVNKENKLNAVFESQKDLITTEGMASSLNNVSADTKAKIADMISGSYDVLTDGEKRLIAERLQKDVRFKGKDIAGDEVLNAEFQQALQVEIDRFNKTKLAQDGDSILSAIEKKKNDSKFMSDVEELYLKKTNGKELKYASEMEKDQFILDNYKDQLYLHPRTKKGIEALSHFVPESDADIIKNNEDIIKLFDANGSKESKFKPLIQSLEKGGDEGTEIINSIKRDLAESTLKNADSLTRELDPSKLSGDEKRAYDFNRRILETELRTNGNKVMDNILTNANFIGKGEIKAEIKKIFDELNKDNKNNKFSEDEKSRMAVELYFGKHSEAKEHLLNMAAGDMTLALDQETLMNKRVDAIKGNATLNALAIANGLDFTNMKKDEFGNYIDKNGKYVPNNTINDVIKVLNNNNASKALLHGQVTKAISPGTNVSEHEINQFFSNGDVQATTQKSGKKMHLADAIKEYAEQDDPEFKRNMKGVVFKVFKKLPKGSAAYDNWNKLLQRQMEAISSGKGQFATLSKAEQDAKIQELKQKLIYQGGNKPKEYANMSAEEQREFDIAQRKLMVEAIRTKNFNKAYKSSIKVQRASDKDAMRELKSKGELSYVKSGRFAQKHQRNYSEIYSAITRYNATKSTRNDDVEFGDHFNSFAQSYLTPKQYKELQKRIEERRKNIKGKRAYTNDDNKELFERMLARTYRTASKKVAKDRNLKPKTFFEERGIGENVVRYRSFKSASSVASQINKQMAANAKRIRTQNEATTILNDISNVQNVMKGIKNVANSQDYLNKIVGALGANSELANKINNLYKKSLLGNLGDKSIYIQRRAIENLLASELKKNEKRRASAGYIPADLSNASGFKGKTYKVATNQSLVQRQKIRSDELNDALKKVSANMNLSGTAFDNLVKSLPQHLLKGGAGSFKNTTALRNYLEKQLQKSNNSVTNREAKMSGEDLKRLSGVLVNKKELFKGGVSQTVIKAMDDVNRRRYSQIMSNYNSAKAKVEAERVVQQELAKLYNKLANGPASRKNRAQMQKIYDQLEKSKQQLQRLEKLALNPAKAKKEQFEARYSNIQLRNAKATTGSATSGAPILGGTAIFKGGVKIPPNSATYKQAEAIARNMAARSRAIEDELRTKFRTLYNEILKNRRGIANAKDTLGDVRRKNKAYVEEIRKKLERDINKKSTENKRNNEDLRYILRKLERADKDLVDKLRSIGIKID